MPAVMLFEDPNCRGRSRRFFYEDPNGHLASDYANADIGASDVKAVMVPLGLRLTIFDDDAWLVNASATNYNHFYGALVAAELGVNTVKC